ncbi:CvfB family protein [Agaribacter flavus]|uniref:S1 RNA-binding domain-containing protein n=1 Tax=Agaribacter flavus TaxID=1902781 RepID=A0ABV7FQK9_9ALTE
MLTPGKYTQLQIGEILPMGVYAFDPKGDIEQTVFIPYVSDSYQSGQTINTFVYYDEEGNLQGTTEDVRLRIGQFSALKIKSIIGAGAFVDWGLKPDLFIPREHLHSQVHENMLSVLTMFHDPYKKQLCASTKVEKYLSEAPNKLSTTEPFSLLIYAETPLGFKAIIDQKYTGLLYKNELFTPLRIGQTITGYVKEVRADGKIDLQLQRQDQGSRDELATQILDDLIAHDGLSSLTDKSKPEEIRQRFNVSKNAYKKALGQLYKERKITIHSSHISLV